MSLGNDVLIDNPHQRYIPDDEDLRDRSRDRNHDEEPDPKECSRCDRNTHDPGRICIDCRREMGDL